VLLSILGCLRDYRTVLLTFEFISGKRLMS
jgi:hypothetical protein